MLAPRRITFSRTGIDACFVNAALTKLLIDRDMDFSVYFEFVE
jgi:hypothetical protein